MTDPITPREAWLLADVECLLGRLTELVDALYLTKEALLWHATVEQRSAPHPLYGTLVMLLDLWADLKLEPTPAAVARAWPGREGA